MRKKVRYGREKKRKQISTSALPRLATVSEENSSLSITWKVYKEAV